MRSRSGAAAAVSLAAFAFAALGVWASAARSAIPLAWNGTVTRVEARHEKHSGIDDAWFVYVDGRATHVDADLARSIGVGDTVRKDRWETTLRVNASTRELAWSREAERMVAVASFAAVAAVCLAFRLPRLRPGRRSPAAEPGGRTGSSGVTSPGATPG